MALVAAGTVAVSPTGAAAALVPPRPGAVITEISPGTEASLPPRLRKALQQSTPWPDVGAMRSVVALQMPRAELTGRECAYLPAILRQTPNLQSIDLSVNSIGPYWTALFDAGLQHTEALTSIELWGCGITDLSGLHLALAHTNTLKTKGITSLGFGSNQLFPHGLRALPAALKETPKLTSLDLSRNPIGEVGAHLLSLGLAKTWDLTRLLLGECKIGPRGAMFLAEGLQHTKDLKELALECNEICAEGAWELVQAFQNTPELETLDLTWNNLGQDGVRALAFALQQCRKLDKLAISGNALDPTVERELSRGIRQTALGLLLPPRD